MVKTFECMFGPIRPCINEGEIVKMKNGNEIQPSLVG